MRTLAIIITMIVALAIGATTSSVLGVLLAVACVVFQTILEYGRSTTESSKTSVQWALAGDIVRNGLFLIPLLGALLRGAWLLALAVVVVYGMNLFMS